MTLLSKKEYDRAAANGVGKDALQTRVYCEGMDVEEAINRPIKKKNALWAIWRETAGRNGVKCNTFYNRVAGGWDHERAASAPPGSAGRPKKAKKEC